ncbi:uncharacterized protein LOC143260696 [Megalopta genalis]|uniref:uncharacterized protein LOC143260696 n=1 Tax=Megalopta genalis TaxID=115081 RepID=UPI003FD009A1
MAKTKVTTEDTGLMDQTTMRDVTSRTTDDLLYILLRFRTHQYVITGDIEKMYRQFLVRPEDRKYQQILWRDDDGEIKTYQLNTVTFGLSAAPYLAIRCLTQLAEDEEGLTEEHINKQIHLGDSSVIKTLGIVWNSTHDSITYTVKPIIHTTRVTKRMISSEIARIYDPLGLLEPVIIVAKLHAKWLQYYTKLPLLNNVRFQRKVIISSATTLELHGFCDASEKAYGACVYIRSCNTDGDTLVELFASKSRVAPLKTQSIPRLELCGAVLLAGLMNTIIRALHIPVEHIHFWTDSTIVLHWLHSSPHSLKTFVANRVAEIQSTTTIMNWHHVKSLDNPADLLSRGQGIEEFVQPSIWQHGPHWLRQGSTHWPHWEPTPPADDPESKRAMCMATTPATIDTSILERYSSWEKLVRVIALCRRWKPGLIVRGSLRVAELSQSRAVIIKLLQRTYLKAEIDRLQREINPHLSSKLAKLNPFLDQDGILRVGGRLHNSTLSNSQKHPIILPKSHITTCIIMSEHRSLLHAGAQTTLYSLRRTYWPIDGRNQVWKTIHGCVRCRRANPPPVEYIMGSLPRERVIESRPFTNVGVDYCGPFFVKERQHRNRGRIKVYVAVFVCFATRAVHLELVSDLTSEAFIAALQRFIGRRGLCANLYSDNGSNFKGAANELRELRDLLRSDDHRERVVTFLAKRAINWHFIPPQAPHFGGLWEAAVKSFKHHFKRVVGVELFTFENLNTLIINIDAILNSRPLTPISSDPTDLLALTPGHFLIGDALTSLRERDLGDTNPNRLSVWQRIQQLKQQFWKRWSREYLNELTSRNKWTRGQHPITEGTLVLLREDNVPSMQWPLGRVLKTHPGSDGIIRAVIVKTATNVFDRSVKKLVPLFHQPEEHRRNEHTTSINNQKKAEFLHRFITVDKTWIHHFTPETKEQSKQWTVWGAPAPKKAKTVPSAGFSECRLSDKIKEKRPHLAKKKVLFRQDNAPAKIQELKFELPPHIRGYNDQNRRFNIKGCSSGMENRFPKD